jgi:hypothetical protein
MRVLLPGGIAMDSGLTIRPTANVAETAYVRPEAAPVRAAVTTMLTAAKSVTAPVESARSAGHDPAYNTLAQQETTREVVLDPQTREVIFRVMDASTGLVEQQVPAEVMLKLRVYLREQTDETFGDAPVVDHPRVERIT